MGAFKHTPGPWKSTLKVVVEKPVRIQEHFAIAPHGGPTLAFLPMCKGAAQDLQFANAQLLSAAPDLADALELAEARIESARVLAVYNGNAASEKAFEEALTTIRFVLRTAGRLS